MNYVLHGPRPLRKEDWAEILKREDEKSLEDIKKEAAQEAAKKDLYRLVYIKLQESFR